MIFGVDCTGLYSFEKISLVRRSIKGQVVVVQQKNKPESGNSHPGFASDATLIGQTVPERTQ